MPGKFERQIIRFGCEYVINFLFLVVELMPVKKDTIYFFSTLNLAWIGVALRKERLQFLTCRMSSFSGQSLQNSEFSVAKSKKFVVKSLIDEKFYIGETFVTKF